MNIGFIGCGVYALALSKICKENKANIIMWSKFEEEVKKLELIYKEIKFTNDFNAITKMDLIVIAIPSSFIKETLEEFKSYYTGEDILIASKGILGNSKFISDLVGDILETDKISVISGPTFAVDIDFNIPLGLSLGYSYKDSINIIRTCLETNYLKLEALDDIIGIEFCGSIKNVIAISTGMIEGLGYPESTRYKYLTDILKKLYSVIELVGGKKETINSYAGLGDLLLTSTSTKSRNYNLGLVIGRQDNYQEYLKNNTVEGYYTLETIYKLFKEKNINMEIINILYDIIYNDKSLEMFKEYLKK